MFEWTKTHAVIQKLQQKGEKQCHRQSKVYGQKNSTYKSHKKQIKE
jgi:hypothetical protein